MTNDERREKRYQRRVQKRNEKKMKKVSAYNDFDKVMSYKNLYKAYKHCRKGVAWKKSVQAYITQAPLIMCMRPFVYFSKENLSLRDSMNSILKREGMTGTSKVQV